MEPITFILSFITFTLEDKSATNNVWIQLIVIWFDLLWKNIHLKFIHVIMEIMNTAHTHLIFSIFKVIHDFLQDD